MAQSIVIEKYREGLEIDVNLLKPLYIPIYRQEGVHKTSNGTSPIGYNILM